MSGRRRPLAFGAAAAALLAGGLTLAGALASPAAQEPARAPAPAAGVELAGGRWFDGSGFVPRTMYIVAGRLSEERPERLDARLDLGGGFVVPPFGEAHNHNLEKQYNLERQIETYLGQGIFYVKIANSIRELNRQIRGRLNRPDSVDVVFANGGITSPGGHPVRLYEEVLRERAYQGVAKEWFADRAYFAIEDAEELDRKWPLIRSEPPDFIKVFLFYCDEHELRRGSPEHFGRRGLDPDLLPEVVAKAHAEGLRVAVHVETAADFHCAVAAGADEITHLPGYLVPASQPASRFHVAPADAELAARQGTVVVTTTVLARQRIDDPERLERTLAVQRHNLALLHGAGVHLAVGSDDYYLTAADEIEHLRSLGVFDDLTLLRLWSQATPRAIFSERRIGSLAAGSEADFLVLEGSPLEDFSNLHKIRLAVKGGRVLELPRRAEAVPPAADRPSVPRR